MGSSGAVGANGTTDSQTNDSAVSYRKNGGLVSSRFSELTRGTDWQRVSDRVVDFDTHHPQGMTRVGDHFFVSSVEVFSYPETYDDPKNGYDRTPGDGVGHVFKFTPQGELVDHVSLDDGNMYHPGGIDFDGESIWVPVAEYRPDSHAVIYRINPETMEATEVFQYPDHIGGIVHNTDKNTLHGVSWGSRRFYRWELDESGTVTNANRPPEALASENPEHYIDYQDAQYLGDGLMLASGLAKYQPPNTSEFSLGGIDLVDLEAELPVHQIPVGEWTAEGMAMTRNPFYAETFRDGLRFYFLPEDNTSRLFVYDVGLH
ncbi:DUF6454 family protein [Haladaptatus sp. YSMS36]|uniref:DUF6454 family protein n=1 Tax=Haladaptatus sp. YSMS36 TaxID=3033384 RepID=UPI0023E79528|nr:DUF6454 family protein [Haladaptatus sp. YSMS36]